MPRRAAAQTQEVEEVEESEVDLTKYADKEITPVAQAFTEWITDNTGYEADERTVALAMALRRKFQHDDASRERIAEIREERGVESAAEEKAAPARRGRKPAAAPAEEAEEGEETPAATPKATRARASRGTAKGTTSSSSTSKPASRRGRGAAAASGAEAPF